EQGQTQLLSATQLTRLLADHRSLRLALLNACEGARSGEKDIFSSTAATLAHGGIPAVLAMQHAITDRAAIQLTRTFYSALANGLPVDQAVSEVRKAISVDTPKSLEWGTPVLYLRSPDGILFRLAAAAAPAAAPVPPPPPPSYAPTLAVPVVASAPTPPSRPQSTFFVATGKTREQWVEEGITYARTGRFQEAVAAYEAAIRLAPRFALAHFGKGDTLRLLNRPEEALAALDQAIQLDPAMAAAHRRKGYVLNQLKRYQEALKALDQAIQLEPNYAGSYVGKGEALNGLGRLKEALAAYEQAITHDPKLTGAYVGKGNILLAQNQPQEALTAFHEALKLSPNNGEANYGATLAEQRLLAAQPAAPVPPPASASSGPQPAAPAAAAATARGGGLAAAALALGIIAFLWSTSFLLAALLGSQSYDSCHYYFSDTGCIGGSYFNPALLFLWLLVGLVAILPGMAAISLGRKAKQALPLSNGKRKGGRVAQAGIVLSYLCYGIWLYKGVAAIGRRFRKKRPPKP
ncbi:MAG TPA: tetratricopeptide repeat protein, partial [Ktedonobacterales bacterium]